MLNRVLVYVKNEHELPQLFAYLEALSEHYKLAYTFLYVKDMLKYEILPSITDGLMVDTSSSYMMTEWEELEEKNMSNIRKRLEEKHENVEFLYEEGETTDIIFEILKGFDLLITAKTDGINSELKSILKSHYKPIIIVPSLNKFSFGKPAFANGEGHRENSSFFKFINLFPEVKMYKFISINTAGISLELEKYMKIAGLNFEKINKEGEIIEELKLELEENDLIIMGDLKYFYMLEKITGKIGAKIIEEIKKPIFIG